MRTKRNIIILILLLGLATAFVAAQAQNCELMDGARHAAMSCPAGILPVPLVLGLAVLSFLAFTVLVPRARLVHISIYRPPRRALVR